MLFKYGKKKEELVVDIECYFVVMKFFLELVIYFKLDF